MVFKWDQSLLCALLIVYHKNSWSNSQICFTKHLQIYNHLQPPDAAYFSMLDVIMNQVTYFSMKGKYCFLEV